MSTDAWDDPYPAVLLLCWVRGAGVYSGIIEAEATRRAQLYRTEPAASSSTASVSAAAFSHEKRLTLCNPPRSTAGAALIPLRRSMASAMASTSVGSTNRRRRRQFRAETMC